MQDDNNGSVGGAPVLQTQPPVPPVDPVTSADTPQINVGEQTPDQPVAGGEVLNPVPTVNQPVPEVVAEPTASSSTSTESPVSVSASASTNGLNPSPVPGTPTIAGAPVIADGGVAAPEKKKSKTLAIVLSALAVVVVGAVVAIVLLMSNKGGNLSIDDVEKYCKDNGFETSIEHSDDPRADGVMCTGENGIQSIQYAVFVGQVPDMDELNSSLSMLGNNTVLAESGDYKKIFFSFYGTHAYIIIRGNTYLLMGGSDNEAMKKALLDLGYPDDKWPDESAITSNDWDFETDWDDDDDSSSLRTMQRDTQRRNDLSRVDTSLVQYQTNNSGKLMTGPSYWEGSATFNCDTDNVACQFVQDYLNSSNSNKNEFEDPDGTPYSVFITENWVDNGSITTSFGSNLSKLVESDDEGYTIGGSSPLDAHVIYIVPGGSCSYYTDVVKASSNRNFAVLYQLEDDEEAYCIDDL